MADLDRLQIEISASSDDAVEKLNNVTAALKKLKKQLDKEYKNPVKDIGSGGGISGGGGSTKGSKAQEVAQQPKTQEPVEEPQLDAIGSEIDVLQQRYKLDIDSSDVDKATEKVSILSQLLKDVGRIAKYRAIRSAIKAVTDAFKTGTQNLYQFSKTAGTEFANSMDRIATSSLYAKNSLGAMVAPIINSLAPAIDWLIDKFVALLNIINQVISVLSGKSTWQTAIEYPTDYADAASGAAAATKKWLLGFDELNVLDDNSGGGGGSSLGYSDMFGDVEEVSQLAKDLGTGLGEIPLISDLRDLIADINKIASGDYDWGDVVDAIGNFLQSVGQLEILFGNIKLGSMLLVVGSVLDLIEDIKDIAENGINWDNATDAITNIGKTITGIGLFTGNMKIAGAGLILQGAVILIEQIKNIIGAIKSGDWSDVSWSALVVGSIEGIIGVLMVIGKISDTVKSVKGISTAGQAISEAGTATQSLSDAVGGATGGFNSTLTSLAKNLLVGIGIIAEVVVAAGLIVASVWALGKGLEQVGLAWEPVIENGGEVATAMGIGVGILAAIGVVTGVLGSVGASLFSILALGTVILAELGVATGLFIVEIWGIGKGLDEVGQAWQPVLNNGKEIAVEIGLGTALLVGIGVVAAALGVASVATVGLLPLAIAAGTAMLVELAEATKKFVGELANVADELNNNLAPSFRELNGTLPTLTSDMSDFTDFMTQFASKITDYVSSMGSVTWSSIVSGFKKLFAGNPIAGFADDIETTYKDAKTLNGKLQLANPELQLAINLMNDYSAFMLELKTLTESNGDIKLADGMYTNLNVVGQKLVTGFKDGIALEAPSAATEMENMMNDVVKKANAVISENKFYNIGASMMTGLASGIHSFAPQVVSAMGSVTNSLISCVEYCVNSISSSLNLALYFFAKTISSLKISINGSASYSTMPRIFLPRFASGGYPDQGELFIARESGPEMVGQIGNKTTVANNDQIVEGIKSGVRDANDDVVTAIYAIAQQIIRQMQEQDNNSGSAVDFSKVLATQQRRNARMYGL